MKRIGLVVSAAAVLLAGGIVQSQFRAEIAPKQNQQAAAMRIGVFDSRALAIACYRSGEFAERLKALKEELAEAKAAGNEARVAELEAYGPSLQAMIHRQSFGTAEVDELVEKVRADLPRIADEAGVDLIVSKWDVTYQRDGAGLVDVTGLIVKRFAPDEATLKVIEQIKGQEPVANDEINGRGH